MRFFITGSLQSRRGPRQILTASLLLLLLFVVIHALRETLRLGLDIHSIAEELHRFSSSLGQRGFLSLIEELHIDMLLFSMLLLLLGSLVYHLPYDHKKRTYIFIGMSIIIILYPIAKTLTFFYRPFAWLTLWSGILLHLSLGVLIVVLVFFLFSKKSGYEEST